MRDAEPKEGSADLPWYHGAPHHGWITHKGGSRARSEHSQHCLSSVLTEKGCWHGSLTSDVCKGSLCGSRKLKGQEVVTEM